MKTYRCALVGLSGITSAPVSTSLAGGRHALPYSHASALAAIPEAEVVAICDMVPALNESFVERWGETWPEMTPYTDVQEMIAREKIDVLAVCTPDDKHAEIVILAADKGIPAILCEKPLATTLHDADRMIEAIERNKTVCSVEHTRRWDPFFHRAKEIIDAGLIGEVRTVTGTLHGERAMIFRNGTHILDLMVYYAGSTPTHVFSLLEAGFDDFAEYRGDGGHDPASEPGASAFIQFANGVRGFYNGTKGTPANAEWDVAGTKGRLRISASEATLWTLDTETNELVQRAFPASMVMTGALQGAYLELFAALDHGHALRSTPRDARNTVALLAGMLASHQSGNCLVTLG